MRKNTHGSPGNSKYFIKNQLRQIQNMNEDPNKVDGERSNEDHELNGIIN